MFTIRSFESRTISWWYDQKDEIDFSPSYQRKGRLWSKEDKSYLIDSILNGFDMPKIYLADFTFFNSELNENRRPFAVVDGKQRFEAMFDFFDGNLTLDKDFLYLDDPTLILSNLSFKDLKTTHPKIASKFENFNLSIISIITDSDSLINEMFIRLNKSKPLTGAELRNAMKGEVPEKTREIIKHNFFKDRVKFNTQRGQDSNVATKLLLIEFRGKFVDTGKGQLDKLVDDVIASESNNLNSSYLSIVHVLNNMNDSFINNDPLLSSSGLIPVYYWFYRTYGDLYKDIRNFLVQFEQKRKANRTGILKDEEYTSYDTLTRSVNNQTNLQGLFNVLTSKWKVWLENGNL
ncbi:DUF262 domain-containing protein [Pedobacter changchengzhani]|uniref:DUF262 domain-containing protein n=1 Tax=Pedobacter changchengzhani TaxID=2529274 RepID=A0A4R5MH39_9SPHI|nr:DUF262 domain-containing protein [Pedobacter changchengzhani]TDG34822.1 DUF262 domain-containing protein [Pedobacter changchengzhani]